MTIDQIKAELRRSACEDAEPYYQNSILPRRWNSVMKHFRRLPEEALFKLDDAGVRTFFLLVAEAIE